MSLADEVRLLFPEGCFGTRCNDFEIAVAENALGHRLPPMLEDLYRSFNGFSGPSAAQFFYPLLAAPNSMKTALVPHTKFLRSEDYFPRFLRRAVVVGDTGLGPCWVIEIDQPERLLWWDAEWGEDYEVVAGSLLDAWREAKGDYDAASSGTK